MKTFLTGLLGLCFGIIVTAQNQAFFTPSDLTYSSLSAEKQEFVLRATEHYGTLDHAFVVLNPAFIANASDEISFTLPFTAEQLSANMTNDGLTEANTAYWTGRLDEEGYFITLAQNEAGIGGILHWQDDFYSIHPIDSVNSLLIRSDQVIHDQTTCGMLLPTDGTGDPPTIIGECDGANCDDPVIDVLLLWSNGAVDWLGSLGNPFITAIYGTLAMESVNIAMRNSGLAVRMRYRSVRHEGFISIGGNINSDLIRLANDDLFVSNQRMLNGADLVVLISNEAYMGVLGGPIYGAVRQIGPNPTTAFAIVEAPYLISPTWAFSHEIGHLFGARHNRPQNGGDDATDICGHAWRFTGGSGTHKTLLAHAATGSSNEYILYFSNPNISFDGVPTGNLDINNAGRISNTACDVRDFFPPAQLSLNIIGEKKLCDCIPFYEEYLHYQAEVFLPVGTPPGSTDLSYEWRWNEENEFSPQNPGILIGTTEIITIDFDDYSCNSFFLQLKVSTDSGDTASHVEEIDTEACSPCFPGCLQEEEDVEDRFFAMSSKVDEEVDGLLRKLSYNEKLLSILANIYTHFFPHYLLCNILWTRRR